LRQTVPEAKRTPELADLIEWLGELVRQVDSSLVDEWEALSHPGAQPVERRLDERPPPVTQNKRAFRVLVRNAMFRRVELAARRRWNDLGELDGDGGWDAEAWREAIQLYFEDHDQIGTGADARGPSLLIIDPSGRRVRQVIDDSDGDHDWSIDAEIDLEASDEAGEAVLKIIRFGPIEGALD
jgi:hypothetical protein